MQIQKLIRSIRGIAEAFTEQNSPNWDKSVTRVVDASALPDEDFPDTLGHAEVLDVSELKSAGILLRPSESEAQYDIQVYAWAASAKTLGSADLDMEGLYRLDGGFWEKLTGWNMLGIDCQMYEGVYVVVESLSAGELLIEIFPVEFKGV